MDWVDKFGDWERSLAPGFWDGFRNLLTGGNPSQGYTASDGTLGSSLFGGEFSGAPDLTGNKPNREGIPWTLILGVVSLVLLLVVIILVLLR